MSAESWYRRKTWTNEDQAAFFAKLRRSRSGFRKAQYCRIQAYELQQAGEYCAALQLLDLLMTEWPDDAQKAAVFHQKAECHQNLGNKSAAFDAYRLVFEAQRAAPGQITNAHLDFGLLVALSPYPDFYDEALSVLDEFGSSLSFPVVEFKSAAIGALIANAESQHESASRQAKIALEAAGRDHSGYARHPTIGLVTTNESSLVDRLTRIAQRGA